jgi:hypothetical protein
MIKKGKVRMAFLLLIIAAALAWKIQLSRSDLNGWDWRDWFYGTSLIFLVAKDWNAGTIDQNTYSWHRPRSSGFTSMMTGV